MISRGIGETIRAGKPSWEAQIDAVLDELKPDEIELAEPLRAANHAEREIETIMVAASEPDQA